MRRIYRWALISSLIATAGVVQAQQGGAASARERALAADAHNDTKAALAALDAGLKVAPNDAGLLAAKGRIYWRLLRTAAAEQALLQAAKSPAYAAEAQYWLGRIYYFKGWQAENAFPGWHEEVTYRERAMKAFTAARDAKPDWYLPHVGFGDAFKADGRDAEANEAYARAAALGRPGPSVDGPAAEAIKTAQQAQQWGAVIENGKAFVAAHHDSPRLLEVYEALLAAYQATPSASLADVRAAIDQRIAIRPDPMSYTIGANLLLARRADLPYVEQLAELGKTAGDRFVRENESSYKLDGKVQGSLDRTAATFADIAGWAAYLQKQAPLAEQRLAEAARLSRNLDATNQSHLGELSKAKGELETARDHYIAVLTLAGATPPQRDAAKAALADIRAKSGENPAEFETWLAETLERERNERRKAVLSNMVGKPMPELVLPDMQGKSVDLRAERGNVVLLNFFSAW
jgi:Flp pilus assembly protein TadD